jgi:hypothetical protein
MSRAFERPIQSVSSSKRTENTKQKTIYKSLVNQSIARKLYSNATPSQWAKKGSINYTFTQGSLQNSQGTATGGDAGCLKAAHSYELLLDAAKGKALTNPILNACIVGNYPNWIAQYLVRQGGVSDIITRTDLSNNSTIMYDLSGGIPNPVPMDPINTGNDLSWNPTNYPGYVIGKDYVIPPCIAESQFLNIGDVSMNIDYKWTSEYWKVLQTDKFISLKYPKSISLQQQPTDLTSQQMQKLAPQPEMGVSNDSSSQLERYCNFAT